MKKRSLTTLLFFLVCVAQAATVTVDSTDDNFDAATGTCTLRRAVEAINSGGATPNGCTSTGAAWGSGDTIVLALSPGATIAVAGGQITIEKDLAIEGLLDASGQPAITLDGGSNRILSVTGGASLKITGVGFIRGGDAGSPESNGSAIHVPGNLPGYTLTLERCAFGNNRARYGGAVDSDSGAVLIRNSTFSGNQAADQGGAVWANTVTIHDSAFSGNSASRHGGAVRAAAAAIHNSTFSDNQAVSQDGGAVWASSTAAIHNSAFSGNSAANHGGAVRASTATIHNSTFSGNQAGGWGGAVFAWYTAAIRNSAFSGNRAEIWGGAVFADATVAIRDSTFRDNSAIRYHGGAVRTDAAAIHNSIFSGNSALNGNGGAVYAGALDARRLTLLNNTAPNGLGQALYVGSPSATVTAGLHDSIIIGNNSKAQCDGNATFSGSHNLEGWAADASSALHAATPATCGADHAIPAPADASRAPSPALR